MTPMQRFFALLLGTTVLLAATIAVSHRPATADEGSASVEQQDADGLETPDGETEADAEAEAQDTDPGTLVPTGDAWTGDYPRGLEVAMLAHAGSMPPGLASRYAMATGAATTVVHGHSADHAKHADD